MAIDDVLQEAIVIGSIRFDATQNHLAAVKRVLDAATKAFEEADKENYLAEKYLESQCNSAKRLIGPERGKRLIGDAKNRAIEIIVKINAISS